VGEFLFLEGEEKVMWGEIFVDVEQAKIDKK